MFKRVSVSALISVFSLASFSGFAQEDVKVVASEVTDNIYMITGKGGNIGLLTGDDGSFLIDDQFAPLTENIIAAVKSVDGDLPRYLINTHFHGDHTGGNENLGRRGTLIMSHHGVRERLASGSHIGAFNMTSGPANKPALPTLTYADNMRLHINGETVHVIHTPMAHTDGDSFVVFENANVVHAGDLFFNGFFPFIDAPNGGSVRGMIAATAEILALTNADSKIIPGHGPLASRADLQRYHDMLVTTNERLLALKNQGKTVEEAIAMAPLKDLEADWAGGIFTADRWIGIIYPGIF